MTGTPGPLAGDDEPAEVSELRTRADAVRDELADAARSGVTGMRRLVGAGEIVDELSRLERSARRAVWSMQPRVAFDPEDPTLASGQQLEDRGVRVELVTRANSLSINPLLPSTHPRVRIGPVFLQAVVADETWAVVEGPDTVDGYPTAWATDRSDFVVLVLEIWQGTLELSRPLLGAGEQPPLTPRQVAVARLLAAGEKDQTIARRLDLSARTVEREVQAILQSLGARGRTEAAGIMRGRGLRGRP